MSLSSLYKEILPPSVVEHVTEANFTGEKERNLILARSSLLEIYRIIEIVHDDDDVGGGGGDDKTVKVSCLSLLNDR
jgi:hypothetical protein